MADGPKYPNQQLQSVSLETFFAGTLAGFNALARIQEVVRAQFPDLYVPNVMAGEAMMLRPFQLRDKKGSRSLAIAINQVSFVAFQYPGFAAFRGESLPLIERCLAELAITELTRVVFRYENVLSIRREATGALSAMTRAFPKVAPSMFEGRSLRQLDSSVDAAFDVKVGGEAIHGGEGFRVEVEPRVPADVLRLFVHASLENTKVSGLKGTVDALHDRAYNIFEAVISDNFREFLKRGDDGRISDPG